MKEESKEEMVVLDEGVDTEAVMGPLSSCCFSLFMPYRD